MFFWNELMTPDPAAAKGFYSKVIGWEPATMPMPVGESGEYHLWKVGEGMAGGMMEMKGPQFEGVPPHWLAYVNVADVDAAAEATTAAGGKVLAPPFDVPTIGRITIIADPQGAVLGLITPAPPQEG
jgi:predicted enzyme related to lactoylglutathione lyase